MCEVVIGGGAYSTVLRLDDRRVCKRFRPACCCDATGEFQRQSRVHAAFQHCHHGSSHVAQLVHKHVRVSQPLSCDATSLVMTALSGVPRERLTPLLVPATTTTLPEQVMVHLAMNNAEQAHPTLIGAEPSQPVSDANPVRGLFLGGDADALEDALTLLACPLTLNELDAMLGFIYGWLYFACALMPCDVEMTLGVDALTGEWHLNVLDFGLCTELSPLQGQGQEKRLCQQVSDDIYCDLLGNARARGGFEEARRVSAVCAREK